MKKVLFVIFTIVGFASSLMAQNCDSLLEKRVDKFTDEETYLLKMPVYAFNDGAKSIIVQLFTLKKGEFAIDFGAKNKGFGCTDEGNPIYFIFLDGTKYKASNSGSFDCSGSSFIFVNGKFGDSKLYTLLTDKIISDIKIESRTSSIQGSIFLDDGIRIRDAIKCLKDKSK